MDHFDVTWTMEGRPDARSDGNSSLSPQKATHIETAKSRKVTIPETKGRLAVGVDNQSIGVSAGHRLERRWVFLYVKGDRRWRIGLPRCNKGNLRCVGAVQDCRLLYP